MLDFTFVAECHICLGVNVLVTPQLLLRDDDFLELPLGQAQVIVVH